MKKKDYNDIIENMRKRKVVSIMGKQIVFVGGKRFTIITDESEETICLTSGDRCVSDLINDDKLCLLQVF